MGLSFLMMNLFLALEQMEMNDDDKGDIMPSAVPMRGLRIDDELYLKLKVIAKKKNRSFNKQAVYVLSQFVEQYEKKYGEIVVQVDDLYE